LFIARQPIFNSSMGVYGYELLYRDSETAKILGEVSAKEATSEVLGSLFEIGIDNITDGTRAFVNFDQEFLLSKSIEMIKPEKLVIDILEDVKIDETLMERLGELKDKGYRIAVDDFVEDYDNYPLVSDIVKFDIMATPIISIRYEIKNAIRQGKTILAEKIETKEEFQLAKEMGFNLFQGYFFKNPSAIIQSNNKKSIKMNYLRILSELREDEPSYDTISEIIESDVNLAYRLLRIINNSRLEVTFHSIKKSLLFMGFKEIERWIQLLMIQDLATDKPLELMNVSIIRSKFGGLLANDYNLKSQYNEIVTMLLFSTLDAILDLPMKNALEGILLSENIREALINKTGELRPILDIVVAYEKGEWDEVEKLSETLEIGEGRLESYYIEALKYCKEITETFYF